MSSKGGGVFYVLEEGGDIFLVWPNFDSHLLPILNGHSLRIDTTGREEMPGGDW